MGLGQVDNQLRALEIDDGWNADEMDLATAIIHHSHNPSRNYITVEFKIPALTRQIPQAHAVEMEDTYHYQHLHRMKFLKVENMRFHGFMDKEGRTTIDKVRKKVGNHVVTYYFSSMRRLGLLKHDYSMAMLVYLNYPERFFARRTPCKKIDPKCIPGCIDNLRDSIVHWLNDPEPNTARLDKFFFSYVGEKHRLCMGYTVEDIKSNDTCFEPKEPDYYIIDLNAKYFKEAIWGKFEWEEAIMAERKQLDEEMYAIYDRKPDDNEYGEDLEYGSVQFGGYGGKASLAKYNYKQGINVPQPLKNALTNRVFADLWRFDMESFNARNSIHKWTYNHWVGIGNTDNAGWWCSWNASETISKGGDVAAGLGDSGGQVESQLNQVANVVGWGTTNDTSSSDTQYNIIIPKYNGYEYAEYTEPLPQRSSSLF